MRKRTRVFLGGALGSALAVVLAVAVVPGSSTASIGLSESQIKSMALSWAANGGDPNPSMIEHVAGSRNQLVQAASGDSVPDASNSYLIVERGNFVLTDVPRGPGSPAPSGSVLTIVVDAQTGQVTDIGVQNNVPDLTALGPVTADQ